MMVVLDGDDLLDHVNRYAKLLGEANPQSRRGALAFRAPRILIRPVNTQDHSHLREREG